MLTTTSVFALAACYEALAPLGDALTVWPTGAALVAVEVGSSSSNRKETGGPCKILTGPGIWISTQEASCLSGSGVDG
jgi:hypothetical protein